MTALVLAVAFYFLWKWAYKKWHTIETEERKEAINQGVSKVIDINEEYRKRSKVNVTEAKRRKKKVDELLDL
jgi:hypothetical protein